MRRFGSILAVFAFVIVLVVTEIVIIRSASKYEPQVGVVFTKTRIPEGTEITTEMLELKNVALSYAHRMSVRNIADVLGKISSVDMESGEMILTGKLSVGGSDSVHASEAGKKLFSIEFKSDQANGWWLMTGQTVDIIYVPDDTKASAPAGLEDVRDRLEILEDIKVAAIIDESGKSLKNTGRTSLPRYISFEVTDEQAGFLAYAKGHGRLELSVAS